MTLEAQFAGAHASLIARVKDILLKPGRTWDRIDGEATSVGRLYMGYAVILAAVGPICSLIGGQVFGFGAFGLSYRPTLIGAILGAVVSYVLALVGVAVLALIIDALAPSFGGVRNRVQAFKVAIYAATASWIAGVFGLIPALAMLAIVGLYSLYLLYLGLPRLMKSPTEKALPYTAVAVVCAVVIWLVIGAVTAPIVALGAGLGLAGAGGLAGPSTARVELPGGGSLDVGALEKAGRQMAAATRGVEKGAAGGAAAVIESSALQAMLPGAINGLPRTETSSGSGGMAGIQGSGARATYSRGEARIELSVTDMGVMGGLAGMGGMFNVESSSESDGRYERVGRVDGRMTTESYDRNARSGSYGVIVADRVMVQADGSNIDMNALKAAVGSVDARRIEAMVGNTR